MDTQLGLKFPEPETVTKTLFYGYYYDEDKGTNWGDSYHMWCQVPPASAIEQAEENLKIYKNINYKTKIQEITTTVTKKMIREDIVIED